jgi:hypothetical protein
MAIEPPQELPQRDRHRWLLDIRQISAPSRTVITCSLHAVN